MNCVLYLWLLLPFMGVTNGQHICVRVRVPQIEVKKFVYQLAVRDGKALVITEWWQQIITDSSGTPHPIAANSASNHRFQRLSRATRSQTGGGAGGTAKYRIIIENYVQVVGWGKETLVKSWQQLCQEDINPGLYSLS